ncbi:MAG TPA: hypothetical protein VHP33_35715, partial [Polyangiaceae bacterium]|nr:hypothetical protein [Polyangiaceae bacterium]
MTLSSLPKPRSKALLPSLCGLILAAACTPATEDFPVETGGTSSGGQAQAAGTTPSSSAGSAQAGTGAGG